MTPLHLADPRTPLDAELRALLPGALHGLCRAHSARRGERLFMAGGRPSWMHFVRHGEVILERLAEDGEAVVLQRTRQGLVGEASLQAARYHCDAVVAEDSELTRVPRSALLEALRTDPGFALRWIGMLNRELRRQRLQCERLSLKTVQARLLHLVRTEGGPEGLPLASGLKSVSREIGVSHEALYRCVAALERQGLLVRHNGVIRTR